MIYIVYFGNEYLKFSSYEEAYIFCEERGIDPDSIREKTRKISHIPDSTIEKIMKLNEVGIRNLRTYCANNYPKTNFSRYIEIIRSIALKGCVYTSHDYNISLQRVEYILVRMYKIALEMNC